MAKDAAADRFQIPEGEDPVKALKEEKKRLREERKAQRKEAKRRARELEEVEEQYEYQIEGSSAPVLLVTFIIVVVWIAILCLLIKLDVGGFGSTVLRPLIQNVPVINKILPDKTLGEGESGEEEYDYMGYTDLRDAVDQIKRLEIELQNAQKSNADTDKRIEELQAEIERLRTFEDSQVEFERIRDQFYKEVVYSEDGPGSEAFIAYYENMNPEEAAKMYREAVVESQTSADVQEYAKTFSSMKPAQAAAIFESMSDDTALVVKTLKAMSAADRGNILGAMDSTIAASIAKMMDPEN